MKHVNLSSFYGFTLIELIVVIAILGILATGVVTVIDPAKRINQARDTTLKGNMSQIIKGLQAYQITNQLYPETLEDMSGATGDLKAIPTQSDGLPFNYVTNEAFSEAAIWGSYSDASVGVFHCWDSTNGVFKISATAPDATSPICP